MISAVVTRHCYNGIRGFPTDFVCTNTKPPKLPIQLVHSAGPPKLSLGLQTTKNCVNTKINLLKLLKTHNQHKTLELAEVITVLNYVQGSSHLTALVLACSENSNELGHSFPTLYIE
jgi:hypothetical protein